MTRKMKDGYFAEEGKASSFVGNTIRCEVCGATAARKRIPAK